MKDRMRKTAALLCAIVMFTAGGAHAYNGGRRIVSDTVSINATERPVAEESVEAEGPAEETALPAEAENVENVEETGLTEETEILEETEDTEEAEPAEETEITEEESSFTVSISFVDMPEVLREGDILTIAAVIDGDIIEPSYRWQKLVDGEWMDIPGANGDTYSFEVTIESVGDKYRVDVEDVGAPQPVSDEETREAAETEDNADDA